MGGVEASQVFFATQRGPRTPRVRLAWTMSLATFAKKNAPQRSDACSIDSEALGSAPDPS